jgi:hypothetical protein
MKTPITCLSYSLLTVISAHGQDGAKPAEMPAGMKAVLAQAKACEEAYAKGDVAALTGMFTDVAEYTSDVGSTFSGRPTIKACLRDAFRINKGAKLTIHSKYDWARGGSFITRNVTVKRGDEPVMEGWQVIGWDLVEEGIRSWTFDDAGGYSEGRWTREGQRWLDGDDFQQNRDDRWGNIENNRGDRQSWCDQNREDWQQHREDMWDYRFDRAEEVWDNVGDFHDNCFDDHWWGGCGWLKE